MKGFLTNLFLPHSGNNHRSKLLHHKVLVLTIALLFAASLILPILKTTFPEVLGSSVDISTAELLLLTNQKRQELGLAALTLNEELSLAAQLKAKDMFTKNYWAHNAPDGITPWFFIKKAGYEYAYAGENLARGFTHSKDVVDAWMASPSHRENMISKNYQDIGFAFMEGKMNGQETILVVEMFGNKDFPAVAVIHPPQGSYQTSAKQIAGELPQSPTSVLASLRNNPLISSTLLSRNTGLAILFLFISTFILDMIIVERRKIVRFGGHNIDHALFLGMISLIFILIGRGVIL